MSLQRIAFKVHGTVQGVNFRYGHATHERRMVKDVNDLRSFTQRQAESYGLTGWVKNTNDDKVR